MRPTFRLLLPIALLLPDIAEACPSCAAARGSGPLQSIAILAMIAVPFLIVGLVVGALPKDER